MIRAALGEIRSISNKEIFVTYSIIFTRTMFDAETKKRQRVFFFRLSFGFAATLDFLDQSEEAGRFLH
jgi:hypothetical protein